jgi:hypothetical protein
MLECDSEAADSCEGGAAPAAVGRSVHRKARYRAVGFGTFDGPNPTASIAAA